MFLFNFNSRRAIQRVVPSIFSAPLRAAKLANARAFLGARWCLTPGAPYPYHSIETGIAVLTQWRERREHERKVTNDRK